MKHSGETIRQTVQKRYGGIALAATNNKPVSCGCSTPNLDPDQISSLLGYSAADLDNVPKGANLGLGCGNPGAVARIREGDVVVDLGSGGGFDCFLAARKTGEKGLVIGVDMTPEMISLARKNRETAGAKNVEFRLGEIEHLPVADNTADLIISNCVINLSADKSQVFREAFRVLKPGGRLAVSDILALKALPDEIRQDLNLVSACIGGAATVEETKELLKAAGFKEIRIEAKPVDPELVETYLPGSRTGEYVAPAEITAIK